MEDRLVEFEQPRGTDELLKFVASSGGRKAILFSEFIDEKVPQTLRLISAILTRKKISLTWIFVNRLNASEWNIPLILPK